MQTEGALEAQYELMVWEARSPAPHSATTIDEWVLRELARDLDDQIEALVSTAADVPGDFRVVLRADGGLWLTTGHRALCTIFDVPADAWMPAR
ncbi:MAG: hypothetical protein JWM10_1360 [Myxococcaceae bacterium]|nr:hypothetical protein [Myxococcaceae bacterium]